MIRGTCFINDVSLVAIIDTGVTHSFISHDSVNKLNLEVFSRICSMIINTPTNGLVTTSFGVNLICLPLSQLNVILGVNWLEFNHIYINCFL